ncbi:hypothetical protein SESBI_08393 [Sesbania bispinosa]|nr:hypothetical protein SESBI_08393 [Sesbania bispinosa]
MASVEQNANKVAGSVEEEDNNMVKEIGFKEKKSKNPTEKERLQSSTEQPPEATMVMDLFNKIGNSLIVQMKKFRGEMKASKDTEEQAGGENDDDVPTDRGEGKRKGGRGRKSRNKIVGKMSFSFELPLICFRNNFDIEKVFSTRYSGGEFSHKFTITERLQNWNMEEKGRDTTPKMRDFYYYHLPSDQRCRSRPEVVRFVLYGTAPIKPGTKTRKRKHFRKRTKKGKATKHDNDLGSGSMESRKWGNRVEGSSQPERMEIHNDPESIEIENELESKGMENEIVNDPWME